MIFGKDRLSTHCGAKNLGPLMSLMSRFRPIPRGRAESVIPSGADTRAAGVYKYTPLSVSGTWRTNARHCLMSAFGGKADIVWACCNVR